MNRVSFNDEENFTRTLELSVRYSSPILIENVQEELDPLVDPILEKNYIIKAGRKYVRVGTDLCEFNEKTF